MSGVKELIANLEAHQSRKESGRVYVYLKQSTGITIANIDIDAGELCNLTCANLEWGEALSLMTGEIISKVMFVARKKDAAPAAKVVPLAMSELIKILADSRNENTLTDLSQLTGDPRIDKLVGKVADVVVQLIGKSGSDQVEAIMKTHPPAKDVGKFINACKVMVSNMVGSDLAEMHFAKISFED
jgi:hypothetical protein